MKSLCGERIGIERDGVEVTAKIPFQLIHRGGFPTSGFFWFSTSEWREEEPLELLVGLPQR